MRRAIRRRPVSDSDLDSDQDGQADGSRATETDTAEHALAVREERQAGPQQHNWHDPIARGKRVVGTAAEVSGRSPQLQLQHDEYNRAEQEGGRVEPVSRLR